MHGQKNIKLNDYFCVKVKVLFIQCSQIPERDCKVPRLPPVVVMVREACR